MQSETVHNFKSQIFEQLELWKHEIVQSYTDRTNSCLASIQGVIEENSKEAGKDDLVEEEVRRKSKLGHLKYHDTTCPKNPLPVFIQLNKSKPKQLLKRKTNSSLKLPQVEENKDKAGEVDKLQTSMTSALNPK